jgi:CheY-like chemotaxis protein
MKRYRVLVVEDDKDAADSLALLMRLAGYEVEVAYSPHVALVMAEKQRRNVILLDIGLPRLDGYEVARTLRKRPLTKNALIIAVTGLAQASAREASAAAGFDLHLVKPIEVQQLIRTIRDHPRLAYLPNKRPPEVSAAIDECLDRCRKAPNAHVALDAYMREAEETGTLSAENLRTVEDVVFDRLRDDLAK